MITSTSNSKIKYVRRLQSDKRFRRREQIYVAEGTRWLKEVVVANISPQLILVTEQWLQTAVHHALLQQISSPYQLVSEQLLTAISDTKTPSGILLLLPQQTATLPTHPDLLLILDGVANPGNLGAMLRTAGAVGVDGVLLAPNCVDLYNPKVVRGSMGALLRVSVWEQTWAEIEAAVSGLSVWLSVVEAETSYTAVSWQNPSALIIGSEAHGVSQEARRLATNHLTIPMADATESLNAAVAAGIILFEAVRQRADL
ncbi:MAG: RNA methyltransferase [Chloroflexota bacterium]